jgi:hypothetical protein
LQKSVFLISEGQGTTVELVLLQDIYIYLQPQSNYS